MVREQVPCLKDWMTKKLSQHNIDPDTYGHTDISNRPSLLIQNYSKQRVPCITVIHLRDTRADFLFASRHDPLNIGQGEPGMDYSGDNDRINTSESTDSVIPSPNKIPVRKRKARNEDEVAMITMLI